MKCNEIVYNTQKVEVSTWYMDMVHGTHCTRYIQPEYPIQPIKLKKTVKQKKKKTLKIIIKANNVRM